MFSRLLANAEGGREMGEKPLSLVSVKLPHIFILPADAWIDGGRQKGIRVFLFFCALSHAH